MTLGEEKGGWRERDVDNILDEREVQVLDLYFSGPKTRGRWRVAYPKSRGYPDVSGFLTSRQFFVLYDHEIVCCSNKVITRISFN